MPPKKKAVRKPAKTNCYIYGCGNKAAVWIRRWEGSPESGQWAEAKVCTTHSAGHERARSQRG